MSGSGDASIDIDGLGFPHGRNEIPLGHVCTRYICVQSVWLYSFWLTWSAVYVFFKLLVFSRFVRQAMVLRGPRWQTMLWTPTA